MRDFNEKMGHVLDQVIFGTTDPAVIRKKFEGSYEAWLRETSTFGGYLRGLRLVRELSAQACATLVGVSRARWQSWEADRETPTVQEIEAICDGLGFGEKKYHKLVRLRTEAPKHRLISIARFRPEYLAARGVAKIEASLEWKRLPVEVQEALSVWGQEHGHTTFGDLLTFFTTLRDDAERTAWAEEVLTGAQ